MAAKRRVLYVFASMVLVFVVPVLSRFQFHAEQVRSSVEISSLEGILFLTAFWSLFSAWLLLLLGAAKVGMIVSLMGLVALTAFPVASGRTVDYSTLEFLSWFAAYSVLVWGFRYVLLSPNVPKGKGK